MTLSSSVRLLMTIAIASIGIAAVACAPGGGAAGTGRWDAKAVGQSIQSQPFTPVVVNSNLGVEPTRLAVALLSKDQTLVSDADVTLRLFHLAEDPEKSPTTATAAGTFHLTGRQLDTGDGRPGSLQTMYTAIVKFDQAGTWGGDIDVSSAGKTYRNMRVVMQVLAHTSEPAIGDAAPRSKQKTTADTPNIADIDTTTPPNPGLHDKTVDAAIALGKPSVVAFVTPAFCQTRFCGPVLQNVVIPAWKTYGDRVTFMHIEPYDIAAARRGAVITTPTTEEWKLRAEPFIAVIDRQGKISAKLEGIIGADELTQALDAVLAAK